MSLGRGQVLRWAQGPEREVETRGLWPNKSFGDLVDGLYSATEGIGSDRALTSWYQIIHI